MPYARTHPEDLAASVRLATPATLSNNASTLTSAIDQTPVDTERYVRTARARTRVHAQTRLYPIPIPTSNVSASSRATRTAIVPATQCATPRSDACAQSPTSAMTADVS